MPIEGMMAMELKTKKLIYKTKKMAFKMKGSPMMANTKSHGTNENFKKSGMKNADGSAVKSGPPFFGGLAKKALDPLGLFGGKKKSANCPKPAAPPAAAAGVPPPATGAAPVNPTAPAAAAPAAAPVEETPAAPMKRSAMKKASPAKGILSTAKKYASKAYDKASQVGMGLKEMGKELSGRRSDYTSAGVGTKQPVRAFKDAYNKEKDIDEGRANLDSSNQKRDNKANPKAMKKAMVARANKKKADAVDKAAKLAKYKKAKKKKDDMYKRQQGSGYKVGRD